MEHYAQTEADCRRWPAMTSFRQIEANRRNARRGAGPRTEGGKQRSRCNAVRHGLTAETVIGALEEPKTTRPSKRGLSRILARSRFLTTGSITTRTEFGAFCMDRGKVLFVVTVMPDENVCRIISARKATRHEQERYFQGGPLLS